MVTKQSAFKNHLLGKTTLQKIKKQTSFNVMLKKSCSRRRKRDPSNWKRNVRKCLRLHGQSYTNLKGRVTSPITEGPECNCRQKCFNIVRAEVRESLRNRYYSLNDYTSQRLFLCKCITPCEPKRRRRLTEDLRKRSFSFKYSASFEGKTYQICKQALASIFGIKIAKINYMCELVSKGSPGSDERGKHNTRPNRTPEEVKQHIRDFINTVPKYVSHYTRRHNPNRHYLSPELNEKKLYVIYVQFVTERAILPATFRTFREVFVCEFNMHFGHPKLDTCKTCDKLTIDIKHASDEDAQRRCEQEKELHLRKAEAAQTLMKNDFLAVKSNNQIWTIAFDMQQAFPTPHIQTNVVFYSRQLWTYNLGVHDVDGGSMHIWAEDTASRGSQDIASCLMSYFKNKSHILEDKKKLIAWSDSCGGQNKNKNIVAFWYYLVHNIGLFDEIEHKFPLPGHTFLHCDRDFGVIEKKKRSTPAIYTPDQWADLIKDAKRIKPFHVTKMRKEMFFSLDPVVSSLVFRKKCVKGDPVQMQKASKIKVSKDNPDAIFFAYSYSGIDIWQEVNISKRGKKKSSKGITCSLLAKKKASICEGTGLEKTVYLYSSRISTILRRNTECRTNTKKA